MRRRVRVVRAARSGLCCSSVRSSRARRRRKAALRRCSATPFRVAVVLGGAGVTGADAGAGVVAVVASSSSSSSALEPASSSSSSSSTAAAAAAAAAGATSGALSGRRCLAAFQLLLTPGSDTTGRNWRACGGRVSTRLLYSKGMEAYSTCSSTCSTTCAFHLRISVLTCSSKQVTIVGTTTGLLT